MHKAEGAIIALKEEALHLVKTEEELIRELEAVTAEEQERRERVRERLLKHVQRTGEFWDFEDMKRLLESEVYEQTVGMTNQDIFLSLKEIGENKKAKPNNYRDTCLCGESDVDTDKTGAATPDLAVISQT